MRALYISHNGMLENLGQSQVLPYLRGLTKRGVSFDLFSFELPDATDAAIEELRASLTSQDIHWTPLRRARDPRLQTKVIESSEGVVRALMSALRHQPRIVHGRSYLPTAIANLIATLVPRSRLIFDCRGMLGDEYLDAGYWTEERLEYRLLKQYERHVFHRAEGVVFLTEALRRIAEIRGWVRNDRAHVVTAIPCCVDLDRFRFDAAARVRIRRELCIPNDQLVVVYAGSLGGWYQDEELATFVGLTKRHVAPRKLTALILTHQSSEALETLFAAHGVMRSEIVVRKAPPAEMYAFLSAADLAVSFIKSCFSKIGSSPTKVAEYLACGLPVILNGDIGDQRDLAEESDACVVLESLRTNDLAAAVPAALGLALRSVEERSRATRDVARRRFDLETVGVTRYERLYAAVGAL